MAQTANVYTIFTIFWLPAGWHFEQSNDGNPPNANDTRYETLINQFFNDLSGSDLL